MTDMTHWHCIDGCEKSAGVMSAYVGGGQHVCIKCGAPFLPCTPETCPDAKLETKADDRRTYVDVEGRFRFIDTNELLYPE